MLIHSEWTLVACHPTSKRFSHRHAPHSAPASTNSSPTGQTPMDQPSSCPLPTKYTTERALHATHCHTNGLVAQSAQTFEGDSGGDLSGDSNIAPDCPFGAGCHVRAGEETVQRSVAAVIIFGKEKEEGVLRCVVFKIWQRSLTGRVWCSVSFHRTHKIAGLIFVLENRCCHMFCSL